MIKIFLCMGAVGALLSSCSGSAAGGVQSPAPVALSPTSPTQTLPPPGGAASVRAAWSTDALLFSGTGTWSTEVSAIEAIFSAHNVSYTVVTSAQLDSMQLSDLAQFGMFVFPGGEGTQEAQSLSAATHANLRAAVQVAGVSYIGFCAGAFIGVAPAPAAGQDVSYGFGIVSTPLLAYYELESQNVTYQSTLESFPDGSTMPILWYGGPVTPNVGVIAKYPTGEPAISEMWSGAGYVVLSGVHPTISSTDLTSLGVTPNTDETAFAWSLFNSALNQKPLPTF